MENRKYKVDRDLVHVGQVVRAYDIYTITPSMNKDNVGQMEVGVWRPSRSILFIPTQDKLVNDLLYNSPRYKAVNMSDNVEGYNGDEGRLIVKDTVSLALLLQFFNYPETLTYKDIIKIRDVFFTGQFAKDNCELFGFRETQAEDVTFYAWGKPVTDPRELKKKRKEFKREQAAGRRMFTSFGEATLPIEYWDLLDQLGDSRDIEDAGIIGSLDPFRPTKVEGPIKKLKRF